MTKEQALAILNDPDAMKNSSQILLKKALVVLSSSAIAPPKDYKDESSN